MSEKDKSLNAEEKICILEQKLEVMSNRLVEAENTRSQFISNMLNEVHNPLTSIVGLSQQILTVKDPDWPQVEESFRWISEEGSYLQFQLRNVFNAAEFEAGTHRLNLARVHLNVIWAKAVTQYTATLHRKNLKLSTNGEFMIPATFSGSVLFRSDPNIISLILLNLLDNAIKFSHPESKIEVNFELSDDGGINLLFKDTGIGMTEKDRLRIFDRFWQHDTSTTKQYRGMGLGLSVVHACVEVLGGKINVESEIGEGTTFSVELPELEEGEHVDSPMDNIIFYDDDGDDTWEDEKF
jgi:signal transduction histidine kinase